MKCNVFSVALLVAAFGFAPQPAAAAERAARPAGMLPPHEIITIVRSAGLKPMSKPTLKGSTYLLSAVDDEGSKVRVVVDGRVGELISVTPVAYSGREYDPLRPSVYDSGSPTYGPAPPVYRAAPPVLLEDEPEPPVYRRAPPAVAVPVPVMPPPREREFRERDAVIVPPPSPLPSSPLPPSPPPPLPEVVTAPLAPPSEVMVAPEGEDGELLPPPPPRFPQRVNATPAAKPKASKSAAKPAAKPAAPAN